MANGGGSQICSEDDLPMRFAGDFGLRCGKLSEEGETSCFINFETMPG